MVFFDDAALWHQMVYAPSEVLPLSSKIDTADEFSEKRPRVTSEPPIKCACGTVTSSIVPSKHLSESASRI